MKDKTFRFYVPLSYADNHCDKIGSYAMQMSHSIFSHKTYPICICGEKYIPKLGCLLCIRDNARELINN